MLWSQKSLMAQACRAGEKSVVMCSELGTGKLSQAVKGKTPQLELAVSPDRKWMVYDQEDVTRSDLALVENFR